MNGGFQKLGSNKVHNGLHYVLPILMLGFGRFVVSAQGLKALNE
jgi:hypothetical protein